MSIIFRALFHSMFGLVFLSSSIIKNKTHFSYMLFWNSGQGQWITSVTPDYCVHFDFGGEIGYWKKNQNLFLQTCKFKKNILYLSHPHFDHYAFISLFYKRIPDLCWGDLNHPVLDRLDFQIPLCDGINTISNSTKMIFQPTEYKTINESSLIYQYQNVLLPGDSVAKQEKIWAQKNLSHIKVLALGHHGSRTSSSELLLNHLPELKMAFSQARYKKFRHPSTEVVRRLQRFKIPLIRTEQWGNVMYEL